ncbi:transposase [Acetobacterium bakii]|uniref:transposase n=1 Tax=Acetobacterium bakii TaxID=52689 RepID=UPI0009FA0069|nr:transposase [Acetobacterium bakii]
MSKKRKTYSLSKKAKIVLEVIREECPLNEIATNYGVSPQLNSQWKVEFIENMPALFDKKKTEVEQMKKEHSAEKDDLINQIGQLTVDLTWLKKKNRIKSQKYRKEGTYRVRKPEDYGQATVLTFRITLFISLLQKSWRSRTKSGRSRY